ncbi:DEAD/DEAH box helicase [Streptomyces phaeochromogenes]
MAGSRTSPRRCGWKITDPDAFPVVPSDAQTRVLLPTGDRFDMLHEKFTAQGAEVRRVAHLVENETVTTDENGAVSASVYAYSLARPASRELLRLTGNPARAARDAFSLLWEAHRPDVLQDAPPVPAADVVPAQWLRYLPRATLNPAQAAAIPHVRADPGHLLVVAPTGAGKTVIGMAGALRTILDDGRKAAWLVPQRSLTDELDTELERWRAHGLRVERLSGEYSVDVERVRRADLWVATTEKFEAVCRASSLREALTEVGCLVVDEIHLLGDPERGPVLEALLTRVRSADAGMRIIGLSATVSNAEEIVSWLGARLIRLDWRPSTLTWQLPTIPANHDWSVVESTRMRIASALTATVTQGDGSVLVFCGSKRNVRRTALVIAGSRGADVEGVHPDDLDRLHQVCESVGVGLHYKGWDHRRSAESGFRARKLDVLVATTTVAAGVNLPARAVVIQDTEVGMRPLDVATVQQMFGRAGRVGTGEREGWAFLVVTDEERAEWQAKLIAGYGVHSQIQASLPEHVLAEAVQGRIASLRQTARWWAGTYAHHQDSSNPGPLRKAVDSLLAGDFLARPTGRREDADQGDDAPFAPTELGKLTARLMVPTTTGHDLRTALADAVLPDDPDEAEHVLVEVLASVVPKFSAAAVSEELKRVVTRLLRPGGDDVYRPGDLARTALLLAARRPDAFHRGARAVAGVAYSVVHPVLAEAPRYLHWIGAQGPLGTVPPWSAVVAADLGRRVRWRWCQPPRGAGRLLWMCEQLATAAHADEVVPELWRAATARGVSTPDWHVRGRPRHSRIDDQAYRLLLQGRATASSIRTHADRTEAAGPDGSVLVTWTGRTWERTVMPQGTARVPAPDGDGLRRSAVLFTRRGDHLATGWLRAYTG